MNYRHSYHAGNFCDVIKHVSLIALINSLLRKSTAFCYIDTHAGPGYYNLFSEFAEKSKEYKNGIEKIIQKEKPPQLIRQYIHCVHLNNNRLTGSKFASLQYYPGSPLIVRTLIRPIDRIIACELQPQEYQKLKTAFIGDKHVSVQHTDGFLALKAFLPPKEKRGLVMIDPPYENPDEFNRIAHSLPVALKRWETGIYAIWFPIKERTAVERFYRTLKENIHRPMLSLELTIYPDLPNHLNGSGLVIINPPWQFSDEMKSIFAWLWRALSINQQGEFSVFPLK